VLLFGRRQRIDDEARDFANTVANMVAVALERERTHEPTLPTNDELAEASRMASLGLLTASVAHELRGPAEQ